MLQPQNYCCLNPDCIAVGQYERGNINVHSQKDKRLGCKECNKTFSHTKGTPFYGLKKPMDLVRICLILLAYGCPVCAIVAAFGYDKRTVESWVEKAGSHCEKIHESLVCQQREVEQVQGDEICVRKRGGGYFWVALAIESKTRLCLAYSVGKSRNKLLIQRLCDQVRKCCEPTDLLWLTDGLSTYVNCIKRAFSDKVKTGKIGRPKLQVWQGLHIVQCIKTYQKKGKRWQCKGVGKCKIAYGSLSNISGLLAKCETMKVANTAYIERLNATFRSRVTPLIRRTRFTTNKPERIESYLYFTGTIYNFCRVHESLGKTPAMEADIVNRVWTYQELFEYKVSPKWIPPKTRGRKSSKYKQKLRKWGYHGLL